MMKVVMKILFICSGNTCRSPLALAAWRALQKQGRVPQDIEAHSAGTSAANDAVAAQHSVVLAQAWGQDLSTHASQPLRGELLETADYFFVMSYDQAFALREYFQIPKEKIRMLGEFDEFEQGEILDPFGGSREAYETCAAKIFRSVEGLAQALKSGALN
jgi:protein-tyrosine-phosphatase